MSQHYDIHLSSQASATRALSSQVGGHPGVLTTEDGSLLIKPALPVEVAFYEKVASEELFAPLRPFIPKFMGTLKLEGKAEPVEGGGTTLVPITPATQEKDTYLIENLSFPFSKPNILDVKLGTELYDANASPEKRERMIATARATTSYETGVRLTGFQVYDNSTGQPVVTPKSYGKTIKPADLPDGITRFFPVPTSEQTQGLPPQLLLPILRGTRKNVAEIRAAIARVEMRMVGGSILVIYEGDHTRAKEALEKFDEAKVGEVDEDEDDEEEESAKVGPPYLVKLIDFAHTSIAEGQGPDVGVLKGLDTVLELLDERIEAVSTL